MVPNSIRIRNTLFAGICLLLATSAFAKLKWDPSSKLINLMPDYDRPRYAVAGEDLLDDNQFVALVRDWNAPKSISNMTIQLIGQNRTINECVIPYANVTSQIRRLSRKTVMVPVNDYDTDNKRERIKLLIVNIKNCKYSYAYDVAIPASHTLYRNSNSTTNDSFTVIVYDQDYCRGYRFCRLYFDPLFRKLDPLDFGFDFPKDQLVNISLATTNDTHLFVARFTDDDGTHRIRLYDLSFNRTGPLYKELLALTGYHTDRQTLGKSFYDHLDMTWYKFVSSGLSFCWQNLRSDQLFIHCSRFQKDGSLMFNKTIEYPEVMTLDRVTTISNGLILFSRQRHCGSYLMHYGPCSIVYVATITRDFESIDCGDDCPDIDSIDWSSSLVGNELLQVKYRHYNIICFIVGTMRSWKVQANVTDGSFEVQYVCQNSAWMNHGVFSIY